METFTLKKQPLQPMTAAELLPKLTAIMPKNSSTLKGSIPSAASCSKEKSIKPMTMEEIHIHIQALQGPKRQQQQLTATSTMKKKWNSSVKMDKKSRPIRKNNTVRKVLDFHPDVRQQPPPRKTMYPDPLNIKPGFRAKKSLYLEAPSSARISGVCKIPETPLERKPLKKKFTLTNKENIPNTNHINRKTIITPQPVSHKKQTPIIPKPVNLKKLVTKVAVPDTPGFNHSWKSSCDSSFLQTEKEIHDMEKKLKSLPEEETLEHIMKVSPPLSNPFMDYRDVKENFNDTSNIDSSAAVQDDTIMCFEKQSNNNEADSVVISLCDLLNKAASIANPDTHQKNTELNKLLDQEKKLLNYIEVLENSIKLLTGIKSSQLKSLTKIQKSIKELGIKNSENRTVIEMVNSTPKREPEKRSICNRSPVNKSPTYKIPNKISCLRKKVFHKSMPSISNVGDASPQSGNGNKALNMYMKMKEQMTFLNTPIVKHREHRVMDAPDTPALTSRNLQHQLDKLFNES